MTLCLPTASDLLVDVLVPVFVLIGSPGSPSPRAVPSPRSFSDLMHLHSSLPDPSIFFHVGAIRPNSIDKLDKKQDIIYFRSRGRSFQ